MITAVVSAVFDCVLKKLIFDICLWRGAGSAASGRSVHLRDLPPGHHFNYNNDIHQTVNNITKGLSDI